MLECTHPSYHFVTYISWKLIGWTLIRVSHPFILSVTVYVAHGVIVVVLGHTYVPITLRLMSAGIIIAMGLILPSHAYSLKHGVSVLISDCIFSCLQFLVFDEVSVPSVYLNVWAVVSAMCWYLLGVLLTIRRYHLLILFSFRLSGASNENNVALIYPSIVWATVRSLLVVSPVVGSTSFVLDSNWIPTDVLWGLVEIEETWPIAFLLACGRCNVSKLVWVGLAVAAASISQKWIIIGIELKLFS